MTKREPIMRAGGRGAALALRVIPRARKNEVAGILKDGTLKIRLVAPPVEGKANQSLIKFLAEVLGVAPDRIELVAGASGRNKLVVISGMEPEAAQERLMERVSAR
ncbi:MAG TPA: DUF167 domain-containing protein [Anaerolineales bacterium]|nr:DUF167 domain-containing protein [Anaerolineales bacterium]